MVATAGVNGTTPLSRQKASASGTVRRPSAEGLGDPGQALGVVAVEPGPEAFFDDGVVVGQGHELRLVHLPQLVLGQVAARDLDL